MFLLLRTVRQSSHCEHLSRPLAKAYQEVLRTVFLSSTSSPSRANKKQSMKDLQEEIASLYNNIRLFEKGNKFFSGKSCSPSLVTDQKTIVSCPVY